MRVTGAKRNPKLTEVTETPQTVLVNKPTIHNIFIVDASGSMGNNNKYTIAMDGLKKLLQSIKEDTATNNTATIVEFEERNIDRRLSFVPANQITDYKPMGVGGWTPLNQAIGETIVWAMETRAKNFNTSDKVLVNVFTDGGENYSEGIYKNKTKLNKLIKEAESVGFVVTFVGTQDEVNYATVELGLSDTNTLVHDNTELSVLRSYSKTMDARQLFSMAVAKGEDVSKSFYTKTSE